MLGDRSRFAATDPIIGNVTIELAYHNGGSKFYMNRDGTKLGTLTSWSISDDANRISVLPQRVADRSNRRPPAAGCAGRPPCFQAKRKELRELMQVTEMAKSTTIPLS